MPRTVLHHKLSTVAAVALVCAYASSPVSAFENLNIRSYDAATPLIPKPPKGLATKKQGTRNTDDLISSGYIGTHELGHGAKKQKGFTTKKPGKNPVGFRDEKFRTNERLMTVR